MVRSHGDRIDDHAAFEALDLPDRACLFLDAEVAVKHTDAAQLRHGDCHVGLGHRVHRRREDRDVKRDLAGEECARVRLARKNGRFERLQEHVVERQSEGNVSGVGELGHIGP